MCLKKLVVDIEDYFSTWQKIETTTSYPKAAFTQDTESAALWNPFISMACATRGRFVAVPNKAHTQRRACARAAVKVQNS